MRRFFMQARRILHTADWHLGQSFHGYDRTWEHEQFLAWLLLAVREHEADALFIAGDVFDTVAPSSAAQRLWFDFLAELVRIRPACDVVAIAGNHDSAARLDAPEALTRALGLHIVGAARAADGCFDPARLVIPLGARYGEPWGYVAAVPFLRHDDLGTLTALQEADAFLTLTRARHEAVFAELARRAGPEHARFAIGHGVLLGTQRSSDSERDVRIGNVDGVPVDVFPEELTYVALGHLHRPQEVGGRQGVCYAGSPLPMHVSEADYRHRVVRVTSEGSVRTAVESLLLPKWVAVERVPRGNKPASMDDALTALLALPSRAELPATARPYVEVRYLADGPRPQFHAEVEAALEGKGYRLTAVRAVFPETTTVSSGYSGEGRSLKELDPVDVFRAHYQRRYQNEGPSEALVTAFQSLLASVSTPGGKE